MIQAKLSERAGCQLKRDGMMTKGRPVSKTTVNRIFQTLAGVLNLAVDLEWLDRTPKILFFRERAQRIYFLTRDQAKCLLSHLPPHSADMAQFTLETGLRRANITGLEWSQIDLEKRMAWIHIDQAKGDYKAIPLPLSDSSIAIIKRRLAIKQALEDKGVSKKWIQAICFRLPGKSDQANLKKSLVQSCRKVGFKGFSLA